MGREDARRAIDRLRRGEMAARKEEELGRQVELQARLAEPDLAADADDDIGDDLLSLIFTACHPVLPTEARVALTLRLVGSLTTAEIARAFLARESTEPEVLGLLALMELQAARFPARTGTSGEAIPLLEQDRSRWDFVLIGRGLKALERAEALGRPLGPYALQAAIAACHARARARGRGGS